MDLKLALACGTDIPIPQCQLVLHQPTIKEIALIGEQDFFTGFQTLIIDKNMVSQDETVLRELTNFQVFMTIMTTKETVDKREAVLSLFQLLFPDYKITFLPTSLLFSGGGMTAMMDENNFNDFQEVIRRVFSFGNKTDQSTFNPADEQARQIAAKLMRGRERVAAQKGGQASSSILSQYLSVLTVGLNSMSLQDCMNLTIYQLFDLIERYMLYVDWDIDIRARMAGATPDEHPDNWMKDIH